MIQVLTSEHYERILDYMAGAKDEIKIISPFLTRSMAKVLCSSVQQGQKCTFITRLYIEDLYQKANNLDAIRDMKKAGISVYAVKGLHAKLYLFDRDTAILGSANFTTGGFKTNIELSLAMENEALRLKVEALELENRLLKERAVLPGESGGGGA